MRITNNMMITSFLSNLNRNSTLMSTYQDQLASGKRINKLSDDPIGIMSILGNRAKLSKLDQYNTSIGDGLSWLQQSETSITEMNDVLGTVLEKTVEGANGPLSTDDRNAIATLVHQLKDHVVQLGNSTFGGRYIFGGYNTTQAPFTVDASGNLLYNGVTMDPPDPAIAALQNQNINFSTGTNLSTNVSLNGVQLMGTGSNNLYTILTDLETALNTDDTAGLQSLVGRIQTKQQDILSLLADVGGRQNRLDLMSQANSDNETNYTAALSKVEDTDQAYVTMQFSMAQSVYRSALSVGAKVIQPTLLDFLR